MALLTNIQVPRAPHRDWGERLISQVGALRDECLAQGQKCHQLLLSRCHPSTVCWGGVRRVPALRDAGLCADHSEARECGS